MKYVLPHRGSERTGLPRRTLCNTMSETMYRIYTIVILIIVFSVVSIAQTSLTIVDALPPYALNPVLLSNGHFSISTNYTAPVNKSLIYKEDGTSGRPVNYTSHFHIRIDDIVYQLQYELDTATLVSPPPHPIITQRIFRDTVNGTPRINANSFAKLTDGDTMKFVFSMMPVKRSSGAFIRMTVTVLNTTSKARKVGALMLIDTKIGNNDRAPIATSFGYSSTEKQFDRGVAQGVPDFWLAMEGTPIAPGVVARGNLRDVDLIEPDRLIFGNWTDYTSQGIKGLASTQWMERTASNLDYTDSAILLVWDEDVMGSGSTIVKASTEIGIVDSLSVDFGGGAPGGGGYDYGSGGFGMAGSGTCLSVEDVLEQPCGTPGYTPYSPDTLEAMFIVTNLDTVNTQNNVHLSVTNYPQGIVAGSVSGTVIPSTLSPAQTGVAVVSLVPMPRLQAQSYRVPVALLNSNNVPVLFDTIDVCVPGLQGVLTGVDKTYEPVCPQSVDTLDVQFKLKGKRCLEVITATLTGNPADVAQFSVINPLPLLSKADSITIVRVRYAPTVNNNTPTIGVVLQLRDYDVKKPGDTTNIVVFDTSFVTAPSREAEFLWARSTDTLDFGRICVGDTATGDWDAVNIGGCAVTILSGSTSVVTGSNYFAVAPANIFPSLVQRSKRDTIALLFTPQTAGTFIGMAIIKSPNAPFVDTLYLKGVADVPHVETLSNQLTIDTVCVNSSGTKSVKLTNPTACAVVVDSISVTSTVNGWNVSPKNRFVIPPNTSITLNVSGVFTLPGTYNANVTVHSTVGNVALQSDIVVITRTTQTATTLAYGDVLVDSTKHDTLKIYATGTDATIVSAITKAGLFASDYTIQLPSGITLPYTINSGDSLSVFVMFTPKDIEQRGAAITLSLNRNSPCAEFQTVQLNGRGTQPIIDVRSRTLALGRVCVGNTIDTTIEIRNQGNAPLNVTRIVASGNSNFTISPLDVPVVMPDSAKQVRVRYTPVDVGNHSTSLTIQSNGKWITATDTVLTLLATGVICGEISVDTINANVGELVEIPVRFKPLRNAVYTAEELVRIMNTSNATAMNLSLQYDSSLVRVNSFSTNNGMIRLQNSTVLQNTKSTSSLSLTNVSLEESSTIAMLRSDVLLSSVYQTPLRLSSALFANGFSDVTVHSGLLRAQYCAYDSRVVNTNAVNMILRVQQNTLHVYSQEQLTANVGIVNLQGEHVYTLYNGELTIGSQEFTLPDGIVNGVYLVVATTQIGTVSKPVTILH